MVRAKLERTCIVTGAGSGLGRATAIGLSASGSMVIAADLNLEAAKSTVAQCAKGKGTACLVDLRQREECEQLIEQTRSTYGEVEVLVNCAGLNMAIFSREFMTKTVNFWEVDPDRWQLLYDVNVRAPFLLSRYAAPYMIKQKWGRIINVTTSFSTMTRAGNTPYGQAKAALEAATAGWAEELVGTGVTCNVLIPGGAADTPMIPREAPVNRSKLISPSAMIPPLRYLASDSSADLTGMRIIASKWNDNEDLAANLESAVAPAAWPELAAGHRRPNMK